MIMVTIIMSKNLKLIITCLENKFKIDYFLQRMFKFSFNNSSEDKRVFLSV